MSLDISDKWERTALHHAAERGHLHIVQYLIEKQQMNPKTRDQDDLIALDYAAERGHLHIVQYLIEKQQIKP